MSLLDGDNEPGDRGDKGDDGPGELKCSSVGVLKRLEEKKTSKIKITNEQYYLLVVKGVLLLSLPLAEIAILVIIIMYYKLTRKAV